MKAGFKGNRHRWHGLTTRKEYYLDGVVLQTDTDKQIMSDFPASVLQ